MRKDNSIMRNIKVISVSFLLLYPLFTLAQSSKKKIEKRPVYEFQMDIPCYVDSLQAELTYPLSRQNNSQLPLDEWKEKARQQVRTCMMTPPKRTDFNPQVVATEQRKGYKAMKIAFNVNAYSRIVAYVLVPDGKGPFPAIQLLHDHGAHLLIGKEKMIKPFDEDTLIINDANRWADQLYEGQFIGDELAQRGYVVIATDAPMWGERGRKEGVDRNKYDIIAGNMMMLGRNLCAFMHYDDLAVTDFLKTLDKVDRKRMGCMGCSMGAYRAWMLAALSDDIRATAAVCWMTTTKAQLSLNNKRKENGGFANCIPGLRQWMDYPHIASLACPNAMLLINGKQDHLFSTEGALSAFGQMREVWRGEKVDDLLFTELWDIPHSCGKAVQMRVFNFFDEQLKKK